jgi:hypothetical protein
MSTVSAGQGLFRLVRVLGDSPCQGWGRGFESRRPLQERRQNQRSRGTADSRSRPRLRAQATVRPAGASRFVASSASATAARGSTIRDRRRATMRPRRSQYSTRPETRVAPEEPEQRQARSEQRVHDEREVIRRQRVATQVRRRCNQESVARCASPVRAPDALHDVASVPEIAALVGPNDRRPHPACGHDVHEERRARQRGDDESYAAIAPGGSGAIAIGASADLPAPRPSTSRVRAPRRSKAATRTAG